jgi:hypothetical protein
MPQGLSGITVATPDNLVLDAGVVYANIDIEALEATGWTAAIATADALGATRGSAVFNANRTLREVGVNGALGPVRGLIRRQEVRPTLTATLLEQTTEQFTRYLAGAVSDETASGYDKIEGGEITDDSYLENIALAARVQGEDSTDPVIFVLQNVLVHTSPAFETEDENEMGVECEFVGQFPLDGPQDESEVWAVYRPVTGS